MNTAEEPVAEIECDTLLLCDTIRSAEGKFYILGGGWDTLRVASLSAPTLIGVAIRFVVAKERAGDPVEARIDFLGPDDGPSSPEPLFSLSTSIAISLDPSDEEKSAIAILVPLELTLQFARYGQHEVRVFANDARLRSTRFLIQPALDTNELS